VLSVETTKQLLAGNLIAAMVLVLVTGAFFGWLNWRKGLLPPRRRPLVTWDWGEAVLACLCMVLVPVLCFFILYPAFRHWYGVSPDPANPVILDRCLLSAESLAGPLTVATMLGILAFKGVRPWQLGITTWRVGGATTIALLAFVLATPVVFGIHVLVTWYYDSLMLKAPDQHPLVDFARQANSFDLALIVFVAVVKAPLIEEMVFRGALQPVLTRRWWNSLIAWIAAVIVAWFLGHRRWEPVIFVAMTALPLAALCFLEQSGRWELSAIFGSSLLFCVAHAGVWPTPVPLFFLGWVLGYLRYRTRSLAAPILLHAMFNSVSTLLLLTGWHEKLDF
jgi:membrane protease YdiL (CAAX protease family)